MQYMEAKLLHVGEEEDKRGRRIARALEVVGKYVAGNRVPKFGRDDKLRRLLSFGLGTCESSGFSSTKDHGRDFSESLKKQVNVYCTNGDRQITVAIHTTGWSTDEQ